MKTIKKGIVFSNDIERILKGINAFDYQYGITPDDNFIATLRNSFKEETNRIFNGNVTIIESDEMLQVNNFIDGYYPHCIIG